MKHLKQEQEQKIIDRSEEINNSENNSENNFENKSENNFENKSENNFENKSKNNFENKSENNFENKSENNFENKSENNFENKSENNFENNFENKSENKMKIFNFKKIVEKEKDLKFIRNKKEYLIQGFLGKIKTKEDFGNRLSSIDESNFDILISSLLSKTFYKNYFILKNSSEKIEYDLLFYINKKLYISTEYVTLFSILLIKNKSQGLKMILNNIDIFNQPFRRGLDSPTLGSNKEIEFKLFSYPYF